MDGASKNASILMPEAPSSSLHAMKPTAAVLPRCGRERVISGEDKPSLSIAQRMRHRHSCGESAPMRKE